jgi:hypothetical protein
MAQHTIITPEPEIEIGSTPAVAACCHHWVIQSADGPVSNGSCQICGEIREFKNYVESATWGDSRMTSNSSSASAMVSSTSDDEDMNDQEMEDEPETPNEETEV